MTRAIFIFISLVLVALASAGAADHPGLLTLHWNGWLLETSVAAAAVAVVLLLLAAWALARAWGWLRHGTPVAKGARRRRGWRAFARGMSAVAAGEAAAAGKLAKRAGKLMDDPLSLLLSAQAAQLAGDADGARRAFEDMLKDPETEFMGLRGLIIDAQRGGNKAQALELCHRARLIRPRAPWLLQTLFALETEAGLWGEAQETLEKATKVKLLPAPMAKRRRALLLLQRARELEQDGGSREGGMNKAVDLALEAHGLAPGLVPAAVLAVKLVAASRPRKATAIVHRAWGQAPHPDLAEAYRNIQGNETPARRLGRFLRLAKANPGHTESCLAVAAAALDARVWATARAQLEPIAAATAATGGPEAASRRFCRLMARLEEDGENNPIAAARWADRARAAPQGELWHCRRCGGETADWAPRCPNCGAFDGLAWGHPGAGPFRHEDGAEDVAATVDPWR